MNEGRAGKKADEGDPESSKMALTFTMGSGDLILLCSFVWWEFPDHHALDLALHLIYGSFTKTAYKEE